MPALAGGSGALDKTQTLADIVQLFDNTFVVNGGTVASGGDSYTIDDILTVFGGGGLGTAATLRVTAVGGFNAITAFSVETGGSYLIRPTNPVGASGGTGDQTATFNLTYTNTGAIVKATGLIKDDTLTLIDAIVQGMGLVKSDTTTLVDAIVKATGLAKSDAYTLTDAQIKGIAFAFADSYSLTEDQTRDLISGLQAWINRTMMGLG